jgi:iron complex transport system substrate-binding protein
MALLLVLAVLLSLAGCSGGDEEEEEGPSQSAPSSSEPEEEEISEYPVTVEGVTIRSRPSRVISLSPSLTEKLYELGLEDVLVGVSDFCDYPTEAANLPACGTADPPDLEAIADLEPHLILTQSELSEDDLIAIQQMNADVVVIPAAASIEEFKESYVSLSRLLEGEYAGTDWGERFARNIQDRLDFLTDYLVPYAENNGIKQALYLARMDFNVATGDTLISELMSVIGLENIAGEQTDWLFPEELAIAEGRQSFEAIDVIFMDEKYVTIKHLEQSEFYRGLTATLKDYYLYVDSLMIERQSLRTLDVLDDMAAYAYTEATPPVPFEEDEAESEPTGDEPVEGEDEEE